jgi:outer membrane protein TolC
MRTAAIAGCLLGCVCRCAAGGEALTLARALHQATQGPGVEAARASASGADARAREVRAARLPRFDADAQARALRKDPGLLLPEGTLGGAEAIPFVSGERNTATVGVDLQQLLWDGGRTGHALHSMRAAQEAARADVVTRTRSIALATVRAYAGAVAAGRHVEVLRDAIAVTDEAARVVTAMVEQEVLPRSDLLAARYRREELRAQLATAEADEVAVRAGLAALVGQEIGSLAALPSPPTPAPDREPPGLAAEPSELRALEQRRQALLEAGAAASSDRWPVLVAVGRVEHTTDEYVLHRTNAAAAVALRVPLFDGGAAGARAAALRADARALASATEMERRRIEGDLRAKVAAEKAGLQRVAAADQAVAAAEEALRLERLRHAEGLATTRDLLAALADDTAARAAQSAAQAGLVVAVAERADAAGQDVVALFGEE